MVLQQTNIELHDLITVFNDIICKHVDNINLKRNEIATLRSKLEDVTKELDMTANDNTDKQIRIDELGQMLDESESRFSINVPNQFNTFYKNTAGDTVKAYYFYSHETGNPEDDEHVGYHVNYPEKGYGLTYDRLSKKSFEEAYVKAYYTDQLTDDDVTSNDEYMRNDPANQE